MPPLQLMCMWFPELKAQRWKAEKKPRVDSHRIPEQDVGDRVLDLGDDHLLQRVDPPVGDFDGPRATAACRGEGMVTWIATFGASSIKKISLMIDQKKTKMEVKLGSELWRTLKIGRFKIARWGVKTKIAFNPWG